jgi:hypothetical protein
MREQPRPSGHTAKRWTAALMTYAAIARIPLGIAVTVALHCDQRRVVARSASGRQ